MRMVLDTNVLLDGVQDDFSVQARLVDAVVAGDVAGLGSPATVKEYRRLIRRVIRDDSYQDKLKQYLQKMELVEPRRTDVVIDDEEDRKFVAAALGGQADLIVTNDRHLLDIGEVDEIDIVTPAEAWQRWEELANPSGEWQSWMSDLGI